MNKPLLIIVFALLQGACVSTTTGTQSGRDLLTFKQIAAEISVQYEALESDSDIAHTTAQNVPNTG
jgi:hypothetical protein